MGFPWFGLGRSFRNSWKKNRKVTALETQLTRSPYMCCAIVIAVVVVVVVLYTGIGTGRCQ